MKKFCSEIRKLRLSSGLSQSEVASRAGMDRSVLSLFEAGYRQPTEEQARLLTRSLYAAAKERVKAVSKVVAEAEHLQLTV